MWPFHAESSRVTSGKAYLIPGQSVRVAGGDAIELRKDSTSGTDGMALARFVPAVHVAEILSAIGQEELAGVLHLTRNRSEQIAVGLIDQILSSLPQGLFILDEKMTILWHTENVRQIAPEIGVFLNRQFYEIFGGTYEIIDDESCPIHTVMTSGCSATATLKISDKQYYRVQVVPLQEAGAGMSRFALAIVSDQSHEILQTQKLTAIYQAGLELGDLIPEEITELTVEERTELLKEKILHYTLDLLKFDTAEVRLLNKSTQELMPLLSYGMGPEAVGRTLYANAASNGVTGYVAASGKSYLCDDTEADTLYLPGAPGARSSLTVPLILHDKVLGTFNVESPTPGFFSEDDLQFLELFGREVAIALNTLDLLVAEKATTASESTSLILREVAGPVDEILNDAAWILERYIGHEPNVAERLQRILMHTREIRQQIHKVGETLAPKLGNPAAGARGDRPLLKGKRILVVDNDEMVRKAAHDLLGRYGCEVETAHNGDEALLMCRRFSYDTVIADIRLPDMTGFDVFKTIKEKTPELSVILMTGFGYDPTHSIVKARQMGLRSVLYKPFRLDQLLNEVEAGLKEPPPAPTAT